MSWEFFIGLGLFAIVQTIALIRLWARLEMLEAELCQALHPFKCKSWRCNVCGERDRSEPVEVAS